MPFLIDIYGIKWLFFFYYGRLSSAQSDRWQALTQRPIIDQHPVKQTAYWREIKDNGYKCVFTNSWLVRQRNRSWIKGLGKNPQKSELVHCWQFLLSGATEPWPHGLRETIACIQVKRHDGTAWQGSHQSTHKLECTFRSAVPTKIWCLYSLRCELVNKKLKFYR